jgi:hypothetical protein
MASPGWDAVALDCLHRGAAGLGGLSDDADSRVRGAGSLLIVKGDGRFP